MLKRVLLFLKCGTGIPRGTQKRQNISVQSKPTCNSPCKNENKFNHKHNRIDTDSPREKIIHIHKRSKKCGNSGKKTEDKSDADKKFTKRNHIRKNSGIWDNNMLQPRSIPSRNVSMCSGCFRQCSVSKSCNSHPRLRTHPNRIHDFFPSRFEPNPSDVHPQNNPYESQSCVCKKKSRN